MFQHFLTHKAVPIAACFAMLFCHTSHAVVHNSTSTSSQQVMVANNTAAASESNTSATKKPIETKPTPRIKQLIIDDIICKGNTDTECDFILKKYYQNIGDLVDASEIEDAKLRLGTLIQLKYTEVYLEKGNKRNHVVVVFNVKEASELHYEVKSGYQSSDFNKSENIYHCRSYLDHRTTEYTIDFVVDENTNLPSKKDYYDRRDNCDKRSDVSYFIGGKVTNFNFLGTGKELSLFYSANKFSRNIKVEGQLEANDTGFRHFSDDRIWMLKDPEDLGEGLYQISYSRKSNIATHALGLRYYDPHLLDLAQVYLDSSLHHFWTIEESEYALAWHPQKNRLTTFDMTLGYRLFRHSFIELATSKLLGYKERFLVGSYFHVPDTHSLRMGWNSENDAFFPTQGDNFSLKSTWNRDVEHAASNDVLMLYKYHIGLSANKTLTLGARASLSYQDVLNVEYANQTSSTTFSLRLSGNSVKNKKSGVYSHWYIGANIGVIDQNAISITEYSEREYELTFHGVPNNKFDYTLWRKHGYHVFRDQNTSSFVGFEAGYTYQTENITYRFTLGYNQQDYH